MSKRISIELHINNSDNETDFSTLAIMPLQAMNKMITAREKQILMINDENCTSSVRSSFSFTPRNFIVAFLNKPCFIDSKMEKIVMYNAQMPLVEVEKPLTRII